MQDLVHFLGKVALGILLFNLVLICYFLIKALIEDLRSR